MKQTITHLLTLLILLWGLVSMAAHFTGHRALKGLALASCASPYPKVFCTAKTYDDQQILETFSSSFTLSYNSQGIVHEVQITPELYQKMGGPYNRRNVYGAVLAYGPALPPKLRQSTLDYALLDPAPIPKELGLPNDATNFTLTIRNKDQQWMLCPSQN